MATTGILFTVLNYQSNVVVQVLKNNRALGQTVIRTLVNPQATANVGAGRYEIRVWDYDDASKEILFDNFVTVETGEMAPCDMDLSPDPSIPQKTGIKFIVKSTLPVSGGLTLTYPAIVSLSPVEVMPMIIGIPLPSPPIQAWRLTETTTIEIPAAQYNVTISPPEGSVYNNKKLIYTGSPSIVTVIDGAVTNKSTQLALGPVVTNPLLTGLRIATKNTCTVYTGLTKSTVTSAALVTIQSMNLAPAYSSQITVSGDSGIINVLPGRYQITVGTPNNNPNYYFNPKVSTITVQPNAIAKISASLTSSSPMYNPVKTGIKFILSNFGCEGDETTGVFIKFEKKPLGSSPVVINPNLVSNTTVYLSPGDYEFLLMYRDVKIPGTAKVAPNKILTAKYKLPTVDCSPTIMVEPPLPPI